MNRNTRSRFMAARKNKAKGQTSTSFDIPKVLSGRGESASWGSYGKKVFNFATQPRVSAVNNPKVAAKGKRTRAEISIENTEIVATILPKKEFFVQD